MSDAPAELVHYAVADAVATITLDSPHNRNALSRQLVTELFAPPRARRGRPRRAGRADRGSRARSSAPAPTSSEATTEGMEDGARRIVDLQRLIATMDKPVVTRLHGAVRAGGIGIVAASDIAIAPRTPPSRSPR